MFFSRYSDRRQLTGGNSSRMRPVTFHCSTNGGRRSERTASAPVRARVEVVVGPGEAVVHRVPAPLGPGRRCLRRELLLAELHVGVRHVAGLGGEQHHRRHGTQRDDGEKRAPEHQPAPPRPAAAAREHGSRVIGTIRRCGARPRRSTRCVRWPVARACWRRSPPATGSRWSAVPCATSSWPVRRASSTWSPRGTSRLRRRGWPPASPPRSSRTSASARPRSRCPTAAATTWSGRAPSATRARGRCPRCAPRRSRRTSGAAT